MRSLLRELHRRAPLLAWMGWVHLAIFLSALVMMGLDDRTILGINGWIKPAKFAISIAIYAWTIGWLIGSLEGARVLRRTLSGIIALTMVVEMACILLQSVGGTRSHFNQDSAFDAAVFGVMGLFIAINTLCVAVVLVLFLAPKPTWPPAYLAGVRVGLVLFLLASLEGGAMVTHGAHTVGDADGGPGLPFVNWSTRAGDLRAAHFLGLHGLQVLPLAGWLIAGSGTLPVRRQLLAVMLIGAVYGSLCIGIFWQAWSGAPLWPGA